MLFQLRCQGSTDSVDHELWQSRLSRFDCVLAIVSLIYLVVTVAYSIHITGTPLYLSSSPDAVDARADLYALSAVGYWLVTGTHVFGGNTVLEVCAHHLHSVPEPPSTRLPSPVTADLEALLLSCLAKRPEDRPASAHVLRDRLRACTAAGRWTNARAADWWASHRHEQRSSDNASVSVDARSLTINRM